MITEKQQEKESLRKELLEDFEQVYWNLIDEKILPEIFKKTYEHIINKRFGVKK